VSRYSNIETSLAMSGLTFSVAPHRRAKTQTAHSRGQTDRQTLQRLSN